jgi:hypothetical protein
LLDDPFKRTAILYRLHLCPRWPGALAVADSFARLRAACGWVLKVLISVSSEFVHGQHVKVATFPFRRHLCYRKWKKKIGVREARTLDLRITQISYETYALANCATTPMLLLLLFAHKNAKHCKTKTSPILHSLQQNEALLVAGYRSF